MGNGDYAPFVGHNAWLRWKALQSVKFKAEDGRELFWSESHVSEDFDMSLRLQTAGFVVRLASYDNGEFKEGVSLTVFDELLRWEKYAYGCSELVSHRPQHLTQSVHRQDANTNLNPRSSTPSTNGPTAAPSPSSSAASSGPT